MDVKGAATSRDAVQVMDEGARSKSRPERAPERERECIGLALELLSSSEAWAYLSGLSGGWVVLNAMAASPLSLEIVLSDVAMSAGLTPFPLSTLASSCATESSSRRSLSSLFSVLSSSIALYARSQRSAIRSSRARLLAHSTLSLRLRLHALKP